MNRVLLRDRARKFHNGLVSHSLLPSISVSISPHNHHFIIKRNFKLGVGSEWTKEQRSAIEFKLAQSGQPMDFSNPLTYIGIVAPMFTCVYCFYFVWKLYGEKTAEEEAKEMEVVHAITQRDPKLKIDDL